MKRIAILLGTLLISHIAVCEEPVTLKYAFNPEESVTIEVISICTLNQSEMKQFNKTKGKLVFDCRTEEANITENINGASRLLTVKSFSIENFKDDRFIAGVPP